MKIYYIQSTGEIITINYNRDDYAWKNTINIPYNILEIDELEGNNKSICNDLIWSLGRENINGNAKYYIENNELYIRDYWEEYVEEI